MTDSRSMLTGFEKIIEERIRHAQQEGRFDDLEGRGRPLDIEEDRHIPEDLRICHKILKNADCLPPELETQKEIRQVEDLLTQIPDTALKYRMIKKLNFLIMKINSMKKGSVAKDIPQRYNDKMVNKLSHK